MFSLPFATTTLSLSVVTLVAPKSASSNEPDVGYTRYERARIIGARALQVSMGAPVLVEVAETPEGPNPVGTSMREFGEGLIPITVRRAVATERKRAYATSASGPAERGRAKKQGGS